jgi:hypothetical protein
MLIMKTNSVFMFGDGIGSSCRESHKRVGATEQYGQNVDILISHQVVHIFATWL